MNTSTFENHLFLIRVLLTAERHGWPKCLEIGRLELQKDFPLNLLISAYSRHRVPKPNFQP
jgi:hypothetical protein